MEEIRQRLIFASLAVAAVIVIGSVGFYILGDGRWAPDECVYMTVITISTVGFGETLPGFDQVPLARPFTVVLIVLGAGSMLYFVSTLTAAFIEGDLRGVLRRKRMDKKIAALRNHVIVCGAGATGRQVIDELMAIGRELVVIDLDESHIAQAQRAHGDKVLSITGDATRDEVLQRANLEDAMGIVVALGNDKDNLFTVVSARHMNQTARIVARGSDLAVLEKLKQAGADATVSPNYIGGMRLVSEMTRPHVVRFLDEMLRDSDTNTRIEEVAIPDGSTYAGKSLMDSKIRKHTDLLVLAVRMPDSKTVYNPSATFELAGGMTLVVLGPTAQVRELREHAAV